MQGAKERGTLEAHVELLRAELDEADAAARLALDGMRKRARMSVLMARVHTTATPQLHDGAELLRRKHELLRTHLAHARRTRDLLRAHLLQHQQHAGPLAAAPPALTPQCSPPP